MKAAEEILEDALGILKPTEGESKEDTMYRAFYYRAVKAIGQAQKDAYNQATEDARKYWLNLSA